MAINPTFTNSPVLSKVKIGDSVYYLKDAELRSIVSAFGNATAQDVATEIAENGTGLATSAQVYDFVLDRTADIAGAMHFVSGTRAQQTDPSAGDVVLEGVIEYIYDGTSWQELGDEGTWVPKSRTIAGIDLNDNITVAELKTALELKALAYADTASATLNDYVTGINDIDYQPAGTISADVDEASANATLTTADYTPAGGVTGNVTPTGTVTLTADNDGFQVSGTNSSSEVTITPSTESVLKGVKTAAVAPSFTEGAFTPGSFTKGNAVVAATEGVVAAIDQTDNEMLVFTAAATDNVMDYDATYVAPSKAADTFDAGSAADFDVQTVWTGVTSATAAAQVFSGGKIAATFAGDQNSINATFTGTEAKDLKVTNVAYDKVSVSNFVFTGTTATLSTTLVKGSKTVTVSPDNA